MGKKSSWFGAVKKVFSPGKKKEKSKARDVDPSPSDAVGETDARAATVIPQDEVKMAAADTESELTQNGHSVLAVGVVEPVPDASITSTTLAQTNAPGKSSEEAAAIKIQTAFRGYLARRAACALRGLGRLKLLIDDGSIKRQTGSALRSMQILARVQFQIRARRLKTSEENQALQRQLMLKKETESSQTGEEWDDSLQSKEQMEATLMNRQEAAIRRERAMAYAFSHQWKTSSRSVVPIFADPANMQWGWSSLERWCATRRWEDQGASEKEGKTDSSSLKNTGQSLGEGEITRAYSRRDMKPTKSSSPSTAKSAGSAASRQSSLPLPRSKKPAAPKNNLLHLDDDSNSVSSSISGGPRRHSIGGSVARDDESLVSSPAVPSYMAPTKSTRAKARQLSPLSSDAGGDIADKTVDSIDSIKKRLSFSVNEKSTGAPASPMPLQRRRSGPPAMETPAPAVA